MNRILIAGMAVWILGWLATAAAMTGFGGLRPRGEWGFGYLGDAVLVVIVSQSIAALLLFYGAWKGTTMAARVTGYVGGALATLPPLALLILILLMVYRR